YYLVVDANAVSGIYPIKFTATIDGKAKVEKEVSIRVTGVPDLIFESDAVTRLVKPNDIFTADMTLTNIGTGKARNIKVTTSSDDFILLGSGLELIDELKPGRSTNTALEFSVGDEVIPDSYNVPILFDFTDENGAEHNMTQNLGVKLANYGEVYLQNVKTTPSQVNVGEAFTLQVRVENVGTGDAKNVKAVLESSFGGAKEAFIGRLEKDDDAPGIFTLTALGPGNINNKLTITYTDDFGEHEVIEHFSTNVGIKSKPLGLFIAVMIIITLGLAYLLFFRKHRLHNLEK
ncbi:MAG: hypothetical protein KJ574_00770, partial [Nanoarchaeota archaeon]|nr:hypothetical protein [Nanoarchaeota archaeon]